MPAAANPSTRVTGAFTSADGLCGRSSDRRDAHDRGACRSRERPSRGLSRRMRCATRCSTAGNAGATSSPWPPTSRSRPTPRGASCSSRPTRCSAGRPALCSASRRSSFWTSRPVGGCFNPFRPTGPVRRQPRLAAASRRQQRLPQLRGRPAARRRRRASSAPAASRQDVTEHDRREAAIAAALRRTEVMDHIMSQHAPRGAGAADDGGGAGGAGAAPPAARACAVLDTVGEGMEPCVVQCARRRRRRACCRALPPCCAAATTSPPGGEAADGRRVLVCPAQTRFGERDRPRPVAGAGMGGPGTPTTSSLASSSAALVRVVLEHGSIQREMVRQARIDPLTGLLNRRAFMDEHGRAASTGWRSRGCPAR